MPRKKLQEKTAQSGPKSYIHAVGRRKEAVARVRLYEVQNGVVKIRGEQYHRGDILVNGKTVGNYFNFTSYISILKEFFDVTGARDSFAFSIKVAGGGLRGQLEAAILGMARSLDKLNREKYHATLRQKGYLTRDARVRERRKVGMGGKARRKKQSPKR